MSVASVSDACPELTWERGSCMFKHTIVLNDRDIAKAWNLKATSTSYILF